ncbi:hypothetical protein TanjilG_11249 [Lupinus angustifolius]|uniref:Core Histone H2A/H2B/H3 domain-containing protein n=1 Tax=Lupinus angustifolius TaxID=3871 RepID=A0A1J7H878_LUPAN|nr:PREDICTED: histone H2B, gonadal-like [Lupinus angustifolius]OIW09111.1 hypothetical protein TanjilG_11249 [Lupinus angustifolius]
MSPKRVEKLVVKSTSKVVQQNVEVSVVSSTKRATRGNKDTLIGEEVDTLKQEKVRVIPIQEVPPKTKENGQETSEDSRVQNEAENGVKKVKRGRIKNENDGGKEKRKKKRGRRNGEGYQRYVYRVLKQVHPDLGISSQTMTILNNLLNDMFERLANEAAKLNTYAGHMTLSSREIQGAVKLVLPGELGKHAIAEGAKAVTNYISYV